DAAVPVRGDEGERAGPRTGPRGAGGLPGDEVRVVPAAGLSGGGRPAKRTLRMAVVSALRTRGDAARGESHVPPQGSPRHRLLRLRRPGRVRGVSGPQE